MVEKHDSRWEGIMTRAGGHLVTLYLHSGSREQTARAVSRDSLLAVPQPSHTAPPSGDQVQIHEPVEDILHSNHRMAIF